MAKPTATTGEYPKLSLAPSSSLSSLSRPGTPPLSQSSTMIPLAQPTVRYATIEQVDNMQLQLATLIKTLQAKAAPRRHRSGSISSNAAGDGSDEEEELETTVTLGAGHTPMVRPNMQRSHARRVSLEQRSDRINHAANTANREVLGLSNDRLAAANSFLSSVNDDQDDNELDSDDNAERKVTTHTHTQRHTEQTGNTRKRVVVVKAGAGKRARGSAGASSASVLHPDLFSPQFGETDSVVNLLSKSLSAGVKSKKKFTDRKQLHELLIKGRESAIEADGLTDVLAGSSTQAWWNYELFLHQQVFEKGIEAADWYHRELFALIRAGRHDLVRDGAQCMELMREFDRQWSWLSDNHLSSRKAGSFRTKSSSSSSNNNGSGGNKSAKKHAAAFTGEPCKYHGAEARHTTSECKNKGAAGKAASSA